MIGAAVSLIVAGVILMVLMKKDEKRTKETKMVLEGLLAVAAIATVGMGAVGFGLIKMSDANSSDSIESSMSPPAN